MTGDTLAILLGAFFTAGCITIHEFRGHAKAMTPPLALFAVSLGLFTALVALAEQPKDRKGTVAAPRAANAGSSGATASNTGGRQAPR